MLTNSDHCNNAAFIILLLFYELKKQRYIY